MPEPIVTPQRNGSYLVKSMPAVLHGVDGRDEGELREAVKLLFVAGLDVALAAEVRHLASEAHAVAGGVESAQGAIPLSPLRTRVHIRKPGGQAR